MTTSISFGSVLLFVFFVSGCIQHKVDQLNAEIQKANCCGFKQEIHKTKTGGLDPTFLFIQQITKEGVLRDISIGVDSFEFRVWYPSSADTNVVFVLNYEKKWQGRLYKHFREITQEGEVINKWQVTQDYTTNINFGKVLDTLVLQDVFQLKHYLDLNGYDIATPDNEVVFEIAGRQFYRCISYAGILRQSSNIPEVKSAKSIIKYLDREFDTKIVHGLTSWSY